MKLLKLNKRLLLIIGIGVFAVLLFTLYRGYSQTTDEQSQLSAQLTLAKTRLAGLNLEQLSSQQAELEEHLSQATSQLEPVKATFSQPIGSIAVTGILFDVAKAHGVEITEITSSGLASDSLKGTTCSVIPLNATIEGDVAELVNFVISLNNYLTTGVVKSIAITIPETTSENASANIQLVVYAYHGE